MISELGLCWICVQWPWPVLYLYRLKTLICLGFNNLDLCWICIFPWPWLVLDLFCSMISTFVVSVLFRKSRPVLDLYFSMTSTCVGNVLCHDFDLYWIKFSCNATFIIIQTISVDVHLSDCLGLKITSLSFYVVVLLYFCKMSNIKRDSKVNKLFSIVFIFSCWLVTSNKLYSV